MSNFAQYAVVRVLEIAWVADTYDGWKLNQRAPQIGDIGTIVDILHAEGHPDHYVVECTDFLGLTV
jgi:hypothetical protein